METSIFLAKVLGLFGTISTLVIISRYKFHIEMEEAASKNPVDVYSSGFLYLMVGILITVSHQVWAFDWRVVITILGWLVLVKGLLRILSPETVRNMIAKKKSDSRFLIGEVITCLISLYLVYQGFFAN